MTEPDRDVGDDAGEVPRLPRSVGFRVSMPQLVKIALTAALLVMLLVVRQPCADNVSQFVVDFDKSGSGSAMQQMPRPGTVDTAGSAAPASPDDDYELLRPDMTEAEMRAAIERAKAKSAAGSGSAAR